MDTIKVFQLDLLSIRPYVTLKNLVILIGLSIIYTVLSKNPMMAITVSQMFALIFSVYPFMVGEEAGIDPLYKMFGIEAKDVVKGRYLIAAAFVVVSLIFGTVLSVIISRIYSVEGILGILSWTIPTTFLVVTLIIFLEYPIYFKHGYRKGKTLASIPFILLGIVLMLSTFFAEFAKEMLELFVRNKEIGILALVFLWTVTLAVSYTLLNKMYSEKDLG